MLLSLMQRQHLVYGQKNLSCIKPTTKRWLRSRALAFLINACPFSSTDRTRSVCVTPALGHGGDVQQKSAERTKPQYNLLALKLVVGYVGLEMSHPWAKSSFGLVMFYAWISKNLLPTIEKKEDVRYSFLWAMGQLQDLLTSSCTTTHNIQ